MEVREEHSHLGDPAGMERLATELILRAESIAGIAGSLARQVETMTFVGPAADRIRSDMDARRRRAEKVAGELQGAAHSLRRSAVRVREQIHELEVKEERARDERNP